MAMGLLKVFPPFKSEKIISPKVSPLTHLDISLCFYLPRNTYKSVRGGMTLASFGLSKIQNYFLEKKATLKKEQRCRKYELNMSLIMRKFKLIFNQCYSSYY